MDSSAIENLQNKLVESQAETAACLEFLETEMGWEYFRVEQLYFDKEQYKSVSRNNARKLKNYLAETGHGINLLRELRALRSAAGERDAQIRAEERGAILGGKSTCI